MRLQTNHIFHVYKCTDAHGQRFEHLRNKQFNDKINIVSKVKMHQLALISLPVPFHGIVNAYEFNYVSFLG